MNDYIVTCKFAFQRFASQLSWFSTGRNDYRKSVTMAVLDVGIKAPDFTLLNQDGCDVTLADYRGKNILLWWYPRADTPG